MMDEKYGKRLLAEALFCLCGLVGQGRIELPTYGLGNRRSVQLSYYPEKLVDMISNFRFQFHQDFDKIHSFSLT